MEIKLKDFIAPCEITAFVNFNGSFQNLKNNDQISYVLDTPYSRKGSVHKYLEKSVPSFSVDKFYNACRMVLLSGDILERNINTLSRTEMKQLRFVESLLHGSDTIVFENFEQGFYGKNRSYYQKLFQKLTKYGKSIIYITNDITMLFGMVKKFVLFDKNEFVWITDFYDDRIYKICEMPPIISFVSYLNKKHISMEPYIETKEVLKAIYRSVNSRDNHEIPN